MRTVVILGLIAAFWTADAESRTWHVYPDGSGDVPTIRAAMGLANAGDVVQLAGGVYTENGIDVKSAVSLIGDREDPRSVVLKGTYGHALWVERSLANTIAGMTFEGYTDAAIRLRNASVLIEDCVFDNNTFTDGGGVHMLGSVAVIRGCVFTGNHTSHAGGALAMADCLATVVRCSFKGNTSNYGGAICAENDSRLELVDCSITDNTAARYGGGIIVWENGPGAQVQVRDSLIRGNTADYGKDGWTNQNSFLDLVDCNLSPDYLQMITGIEQPTFVGPGIYEIGIDDVAADQGGEVLVTWPRFAQDVGFGSGAIVEYCVESRQDGSWTTMHCVPAVQAAGYSYTAVTDDILVVGETPTRTRYRIVAATTSPDTFFYSFADSGYSVDDIAPPQPQASLIEADVYRLVLSEDPGIPDLASICVYRGNASGFVPGDPIACSGSFGYLDQQLNNYWYRVRFADSHGNWSEFSEELGLQTVSGTAGASASRFRLGQNSPNPFNPRTTIGFSLATAGRVNLRIFDLDGRAVRTLIADESLAARRHTRDWDGRDDGGRQVAAGVYFYRLETGERVATRRMTLVK